MAELSLPACPICEAPDSLFRQSRELKGKAYTWYECRLCGSVLLWAEGDQWVLQKVGREDKAHLLGLRLTADELEVMLPQAGEEELPAALAGEETAEEGVPEAAAWWDLPPSTPAGWEMAEEEPPSAPAGREMAEEELPSAPAGWETAGADADLPTVPVRREGRYGAPSWMVPEDAAEVPTVTARPADFEEVVFAPAACGHADEEPGEREGRRRATPRLFAWLVGLCVVAFLLLVAIVVYQLLTQSGIL